MKNPEVEVEVKNETTVVPVPACTNPDGCTLTDPQDNDRFVPDFEDVLRVERIEFDQLTPEILERHAICRRHSRALVFQGKRTQYLNKSIVYLEKVRARWTEETRLREKREEMARKEAAGLMARYAVGQIASEPQGQRAGLREKRQFGFEDANGRDRKRKKGQGPQQAEPMDKIGRQIRKFRP